MTVTWTGVDTGGNVLMAGVTDGRTVSGDVTGLLLGEPGVGTT